uniref:Uncharacterized protein n=1 Tax=Octopus bimaculoides TaxID=37653 RepID=A0A0L8GQ84_OCTBM
MKKLYRNEAILTTSNISKDFIFSSFDNYFHKLAWLGWALLTPSRFVLLQLNVPMTANFQT